ncbi:MAG: hypothetical protein VX294_10060 [Candidatus Latescibacterota bacterium]|nr:hypothetical protein [Candidatus Latescibacterota bacterium]
MDAIRIKDIKHGTLNRAALDIPIGQITALVGPSGSGLYDFLEPVIVRHSEKLYGDLKNTELSFSIKSTELDVSIEGLPPVINFLEWEERPLGKVGDYIKIFGKLADIFFQKGYFCCPKCSGKCKSYSVEEAVTYLEECFHGEQLIILAPVRCDRENINDFKQELIRQGFIRIRVSGKIVRLDEDWSIDTEGLIEVVVDRLRITENTGNRVAESLYTSRTISGGFTIVLLANGKKLLLNEKRSCAECEYVYLDDDPKNLLNGYRLGDIHWPDVANWDIGESLRFLNDCDSISDENLQSNTMGLGLNPIPINQPLKTLSSSEWQRLRLVVALESGLSGVLYIFRGVVSCVDSDVRKRIISGIQRIVGQGNTVLLVDSSPEAQAISNQIFECRKGKFDKVPSVNLNWSLPENIVNHTLGKQFKIIGNGSWGKIDFDFFSASIVGISGRSGVGKSRFIGEVIEPAFRNKKNNGYQLISERPLRMTEIRRKIFGGRIIDFLGISDSISSLFANTKRGQERGYPKDFYRLDKIGGRCPSCEGIGLTRLNDGFQEDDETICSICNGVRFKDAILEITFNGLNIAETLQMQIAKALSYFKREKDLKETFEKCCEIGLSEIRLNEYVENLGPCTSRAIQLEFPSKSRKMGKRHFFIVDDPACGAHPEDISSLIQHLSNLAMRGATIFITIDNAAIREICDHVIDIRSLGVKKNAVLI